MWSKLLSITKTLLPKGRGRSIPACSPKSIEANPPKTITPRLDQRSVFKVRPSLYPRRLSPKLSILYQNLRTLSLVRRSHPSLRPDRGHHPRMGALPIRCKPRIQMLLSASQRRLEPKNIKGNRQYQIFQVH